MPGPRQEKTYHRAHRDMGREMNDEPETCLWCRKKKDPSRVSGRGCGISFAQRNEMGAQRTLCTAGEGNTGLILTGGLEGKEDQFAGVEEREQRISKLVGSRKRQRICPVCG